MSLGALRHLVERFQPSKPEAAAQPVPSTPVVAEAAPSTKSLKLSSGEAKSGSPSQSESKLNSKISRLRDELQREENRLHFLRQNVRTLELRARSRPVMQAALEGQPAQNGSPQEGVSHWAERLKRATLDEQNLMEKIATLKGQIAELRGEVQAQPLAAMSAN